MTKTTLKSLLGAVTGAIAISLAVPPAVHAQTQQQEAQAQAQVTDDDLKAYATAVVEVQQIREDWEPRIQAAEDDETALALRRQAQEEMIGAVQDVGLTVEEYNQIFEIAQADANVWQQVESYIEQVQ